MGKSKQAKLEAPLLTAYLRQAESNPPFAIAWPTWASWVLFAVLCLLADRLFVLWLILAIASPNIVRALRPPRNEVERRQDENYRVLRRMKLVAGDGQIRKRMPGEVLIALERATEAHQAARARILSADPIDSDHNLARIDDCLHACFRIASTVTRLKDQPRKEWNGVVENRAVTASVVEGIETQRRRMALDHGNDAERLAALRELEAELAPLHEVIGLDTPDRRFA